MGTKLPSPKPIQFVATLIRKCSKGTLFKYFNSTVLNLQVLDYIQYFSTSRTDLLGASLACFILSPE